MLYELVLGLGLLRWQNSSGREIKRHVAAAGISLVFEAEKGLFTVRQDSDKAEIELNMLDDLPLDARSLIDEGRAAVSAAAYDRAELDTVLRKIAHSLGAGGQGEYHSDRLEPASQPSKDKPLIEYAPALILRKRSQRGLDQLLTELKAQPAERLKGFGPLCGITAEPGEQPGKAAPPGELYFPLPANEEQKKIIRTLDMQAGVLVQGPPGTGKSHTIANLISHLLATGQRILVTAKTKQALQVLHGKLPEELRPLAISLLGDEKSSLARSVEGILDKLDKLWDESENRRRTDELEARLHASRKAKAAAEQQILALREQETFKHQLAGGRCSGTAAEIARQLRSDANKYAWFTDPISVAAPLPLSDNETDFLCKYFAAVSPADEAELTLQLPAPEQVPPVSKVEAAFQKEAAAKEKAAPGAEWLQRLQWSDQVVMLLCGKEALCSLHQQARDMAAAFRILRQKPMPWLDKATDDALSGQSRIWRELLKLSQESVSKLEELEAKNKAADIDIPPDINRKALLSAAKELHEHFKAGGTAGRWIFKPEAVRKHGGMVSQVKVDGQSCLSLEPMEKLVAWLTVEQQLDQAWSFWQGRAKRDSGPFRLQLIELDEMHKALEKVLLLRQMQKQVRTAAESCGLNLEQWTETTMLELAEDCRAALAQLHLDQISSSINQFRGRFAALAEDQQAHPLAGQLAASITERNAADYARLSEELSSLHAKRKKMEVKQQLIAKLSEAAPTLAAELNSGHDWQLWAKRLAMLENAWAWAQASSWLKDFLQTDLAALLRQSQRLDEEIQSNLSKLAAEKAWSCCFERMSEAHRQHLIAWKKAMQKIGKTGKGKHVSVRRRDAQYHLNKFRDAVPAWIMPLHQVYETVNAGSGLFDVIIVDEASQCGQEALPLFQLGKRLIVVGDDKQVSPDLVGIDREQVQQLRQTWLNGFDHADSFDLESSLFDHGEIRFKNKITLLEHFRCVPEIIRFSSKLCYKGNLIPLRRYLPDRLEPLQSVFVETGYREGDGQRVINRPEAEAIAETVKKCCSDDRYQGKSIGVVVLQGAAQADLIQGLLMEAIGAEEMQKRSIICGNAPSFQGDERDIIFLSMVAAPNASFTSLTGKKYEQRFNVAASRARDQMWLFHSVTVNEPRLGSNCLRRRLLEHFQNPAAPNGPNGLTSEELEELRLKAHQANRKTESAPKLERFAFDSWFEVDVTLQIAGQGYNVVPQYEFARWRIDLVIQGSEAQLAVECDGDFWHGPERYEADLARQRQLERCGWQFFRIRECLYYADADKALAPLWPLLERMGIYSSVCKEKQSGYDIISAGNGSI
jgi:very-short-patch-repair endonuclease